MSFVEFQVLALKLPEIYYYWTIQGRRFVSISDLAIAFGEMLVLLSPERHECFDK